MKKSTVMRLRQVKVSTVTEGVGFRGSSGLNVSMKVQVTMATRLVQALIKLSDW